MHNIRKDTGGENGRKNKKIHISGKCHPDLYRFFRTRRLAGKNLQQAQGAAVTVLELR
jgi:hypothetical protein